MEDEDGRWRAGAGGGVSEMEGRGEDGGIEGGGRKGFWEERGNEGAPDLGDWGRWRPSGARTPCGSLGVILRDWWGRGALAVSPRGQPCWRADPERGVGRGPCTGTRGADTALGTALQALTHISASVQTH